MNTLYNIWFIRHGESEANTMTFTHWSKSDPALTGTGRLQCYSTKLKLKDIQFKRVLCSPLKRSIQSSLIVFPKTFIQCLPCVSEMGWGLDNICNFNESYPWIVFNDYDSNPSVKKLMDYIEEKCSPGENIAIVCHHNYIKNAVKRELKNMEFVQCMYDSQLRKFYC
jgi:broad specificity phosphatase PhoE